MQPKEAMPTPAVAQPSGRQLRIRNLQVVGLLAAVLVVMVVFTIRAPAFASANNLLGLLRSMSTLGLMALGQTLVIVSGELDLSVGSTYGTVSTLLAVAWIMWRIPVYVALPMALASAVAIGLFNGAITTYGRIPSFIVTLGSLSIVQGVGLLLSNSQTFSPQYATPPVNPHQLAFFTALSNIPLPFGIPGQVGWLVLFAVAFVILLHRTLFGFRLMAVGGNATAAELARLPVRRLKILAFVVCALMAGIASILDFSFIGSTIPDTGQSLTFPVFAAVIIGGASLTGGRGTVIGTLAGALLLSVLSNGLTLIGVGSFVQLLFVGGITIAAVAIDLWVRKLSLGSLGRTTA
jgi:ribose/xylose/arabinose/galactoside ABC-type transport system permease subunit